MEKKVCFIKKTLGVLLSLSVLFSGMPLPVLAEGIIATEFESEVSSETAEEYQQLSVSGDEPIKLNSGDSSWSPKPTSGSCVNYSDNRYVHVFSSSESVCCRCSRLQKENVVAELYYYANNENFYYYSDKFEDLVSYMNGKSESVDEPVYKLIKNYEYTGADPIKISTIDTTIDLDKYCLNLGSSQLLNENEEPVEIRKSYSSVSTNVTITSSNDDATILGNVSIHNSISSNSYTDRLVIKNTGNGCAIKGSSISVDGKIDITSTNNHAIEVSTRLLLKFYNSFTNIFLSSDEDLADINLNPNAKIKLSFPDSSFFYPAIAYKDPFTISVSSSLDEPVVLIETINAVTSNSEVKRVIKDELFQPMNEDENAVLIYDQNENLVLMICNHPSLNEDGTCGVCSKPIEVSVTSNGTTSYYRSMKDALCNVTEGAVIQVIQDELSADFVVDKNITLDLNGKTLSTFFSINDSDVIITDSSQEKSGKIIGSVDLMENATITINEGNFESNSEKGNFILGYIPEESPIHLNGGTFENGLSITEKNTEENLSEHYDFFDFINPNHVYRDKDGNAIYPQNEDSGSGMKDSRIYSFSPLDLAKDVSVKLDYDTFTYNGNVQIPTIQLHYAGQQLNLQDFKIVYPDDAKNVGTKTLKIEPKQYGINEISVVYEIKKAPLIVQNATASDRIYNNTDQVAVSDVLLSGVITGDDVSVYGDELTGTLTSANAGEYALLTIDSLTLTGADSANYEIILPATVNTSVNILPADIENVSVKLDGTLTYNGKEQEQKIIVGQLDGRDITYTVTGNKAVNIGTHELIVTGTGNYTGSVKVPYTISCNHANQKVTVLETPTVLKKGKERLTCTNCGSVSERYTDSLEPTIKLGTSTLPLKIKQSVRLKSLVSGLAAGDSIKSWSINKKGKTYATLKGDKITGKKVGTATITVTLKSGKKATFKVKVQKKSVTTSGIKVDDKKVELKVGKSTKLKPIISPITSKQKVTYKSSNKKVASVSKTGKVVAKKPGKAVITIKSGSKSVKVTVTVQAPKLKGIKLSATKKTLKKGNNFTLKAKLKPTGAVGKVTYETSNSKIATVSKTGKVTAKRKGKVNIIVKAGDFETKCRVTVK